MTNEEYLTLAGFPTDVWTVLDAKTSPKYRELPGNGLNMYKIEDKKFCKEHGKGFHMAKKDWINKHIDDIEVGYELRKEGDGGDRTAVIEAGKQLDEVIPPEHVTPPPPPQAPIKSIPNNNPKPIVDTPPPPPPPPQVSGMILPEKKEFYCEQSVNGGVKCEQECGPCKDEVAKKLAQKEVQEIVESSGVPTDKVIIGSVPKVEETMTWEEKVTILTEHNMHLNDEGKFLHKGTDLYLDAELAKKYDTKAFANAISLLVKAVNKRLGEKSEFNNLDEADARDAIMEKQSGSKKGKGVGTLTQSVPLTEKEKKLVIIAREKILSELGFSGNEDVFEYKNNSKIHIAMLTVEDVNAGDWEIIISKLKHEIQLHEDNAEKSNPNQKKADEMKAKTKKEKVVKMPIVVADDKTRNTFELMNEIIRTAESYKDTFYCITLIKNTLEAKDLTPAKRLALVQQAINNIK